TDLADSDSPDPSDTSGATGAPSSSSSNLGSPEIPAPETSSSSSSAPSVGSAVGVVFEGPAAGPSSSLAGARPARATGTPAFFSLLLTTRALCWASRTVSPVKFLHAMPLLRQRQHGKRACGYQQRSATLAVVHCWHYNKKKESS
ncbi:hypothetical protein C0991_008873, partial [Blastosporella zonata]